MVTWIPRGLTALALIAVSLLSPAAGPARASEVVLLPDALGRFTVEAEVRDGYAADAFPHWNAGLDPDDGCDTRGEVLLAEAVEAPAVGADCALRGGAWVSYYDGQKVTDPAALEIDFVVPLAEAWESGARTWSAARREAFANDQEAETSLVAVTARARRAKADQDPAGWLPTAQGQYCRYLSEWIATKLRWGLSVDEVELETLKTFADGPCEETIIVYTAAKS